VRFEVRIKIHEFEKYLDEMSDGGGDGDGDSSDNDQEEEDQ